VWLLLLIELASPLCTTYRLTSSEERHVVRFCILAPICEPLRISSTTCVAVVVVALVVVVVETG
jgi:hypothetical protein